MRATVFAFALTAVLLAAAAVSLAEPLPPGVAAPAELQVEPAARGRFQLPKLFDFAHYRQLFNKRYSTALEELNRRRLVAARALRAYVSGMKFKLRQEDHYESLNHLSDNTEAELDMMRNKVRSRARGKSEESMILVPDDNKGDGDDNEDARVKGDDAAAAAPDELPEFLPGENEDVEAELRKLVEEHGDEPAYRELRAALEQRQQQQRRRVKRDTDEEPEVLGERERELPQLINVGELEAARAERNAKIVARPASNNPNYEPFELPSFGLDDQQEEVTWYKISKSLDRRQVSEQLYYSLTNIGPNFQHRRGPTTSSKRSYLPDTMFFDHRDSKCLLAPRSQGHCGCCYAFSGVAIMEWLHCIKTGELVAFSEQYFVDCGNGRFDDEMQGCDGSSDPAVGQFVHNFGMELRANYPYKGRESQCPYDDDHDLKKTGYIRMELGNAVSIPQAKWEKYIKFQPLLVGIRAPPSFSFYGGGVDKGTRCGTNEFDHAMVLVGHGRQDGLEFWLIRNSYSAGWGEGGYYKLAKTATRRCLDKTAIAYGTKDAEEHTVEIKKVPGGGQRRPVVQDGYVRQLLSWGGICIHRPTPRKGRFSR